MTGTDIYYTAEGWLKAEFQKLNQDSNDIFLNEENLDETDDFFCIPTILRERKSKPDEQLSQFLENCSKEMQSILAYPTILDTFVYFNVGLPSSAPVERVFSAAGDVLIPKRQRLGDHVFEQLLLLKCNKNL